MKTLKVRAELILNKGVVHLGIPTVIRFMVDACGHSCLFDRLFGAVKRTVREQWRFLLNLPWRLTFHVPSYEPHVHGKIQRFIVNGVTFFRIPDALRDWLCKCNSIVPKSTSSVGDVLRRGPTLLTPSCQQETAAKTRKEKADHTAINCIKCKQEGVCPLCYYLSSSFSLYLSIATCSDSLLQLLLGTDLCSIHV